MSHYPLPVHGWGKYSSWGYDATRETFYATLYKDDSDPTAAPVIRLPHSWETNKLRTAGELALAVVTEIGGSFDLALAEMLKALEDAGPPDDPRSLPLAGKLKAAFPDRQDATVFAEMLEKVYSGGYRMNALEALLCLKVGAEAALAVLYPGLYAERADELAAFNKLANELREREN